MLILPLLYSDGKKRKEKYSSSMSECNNDIKQVHGGLGLNGLTYSTVQNKYRVQKVVSSHLLSLLRSYCGEFLAFV